MTRYLPFRWIPHRCDECDRLRMDLEWTPYCADHPNVPLEEARAKCPKWRRALVHFTPKLPFKARKCMVCGSYTGNSACWTYNNGGVTLLLCSYCRQDFISFGVEKHRFSRLWTLPNPDKHHEIVTGKLMEV